MYTLKTTELYIVSCYWCGYGFEKGWFQNYGVTQYVKTKDICSSSVEDKNVILICDIILIWIAQIYILFVLNRSLLLSDVFQILTDIQKVHNCHLIK